ncbi:glycosyltransferase family 1 protein [Pseudotabrizicola formosa]|uniref:glycosyltransferase family 1 protein n=1 Tax=Pseudotabrizicola formosa TaxID=2030009 RepID=UPI0011AF23D2|nr:glycosyltransferase family 1 protein [Pseudotabrizicola formosa]
MRQRPQNLLAEAARDYRVYFVEEPEVAQGPPHFRVKTAQSGVTVLTPVCDATCDVLREQRLLVEELQSLLDPSPLVHWYFTPMALDFSRHLPCDLRIYDIMQEPLALGVDQAKFAELEAELLACSHLVFAEGQIQVAAKARSHRHVHWVPGGVDTSHFARARSRIEDPSDQAEIPAPRVGFGGVIDDRIDLDLIASSAKALPSIHFVMIGPIARTHPDPLPQAPNIHWLGRKTYDELPGYMANWQAAWMPFALNDATRAVRPSETLELLAAGLRVTSTAVADLVETYGKKGLVSIADAQTIVPTLKTMLGIQPEGWRQAVDKELARQSRKETWDAMHHLMQAQLKPVQG